MISGFFFIIALGHFYVALLVMSIASIMYYEIISLKRKEEKDKRGRVSWIDWYNFFVFAFYVIPNVFLRRILVEKTFSPDSLAEKVFYDYHNLISFSLMILGLLLFVLTLERGSYRYQFQRLAWSILALILVFLLPSLVTYNIYQGFFWVAFPHCCVICNDVCAYLVGFFAGKTPLIKLSPKKTWEGFIGGAFFTMVFAFIATDYLSQIPHIVCP